MKISFDLDGTLLAHQAYFRLLMRVLQADGHQVGILTGHAHDSEPSVRERLAAAGFPAPDFYYGRLPEDIPYNGAIAKSRWIRTQQIDYHYDDCDYALPETMRLFRECLGDEIHRLIVVQHRGVGVQHE